MLAGSGKTDGYAQSGYGRHEGESTVYYFAEYTRCSTCSVGFKETSAASGTNTYSQFYDFTSGDSKLMAGSSCKRISTLLSTGRGLGSLSGKAKPRRSRS